MMAFRRKVYRLSVRGLCMATILVLSFASCWKRTASIEPGRTPVVGLEGSYLYLDELEKAVPHDLSPEDSAAFAAKYIRNWLSELLLFKNAERNIPDTWDIDKQVESYRQALIVHKYEQKLIEQKLDEDITESDVEEFYNDNKSLFILDDALVKGMLLKLPLNAPDQTKVRGWYVKTDDASMDELDKYAMLNAVRYEVFYDKWTSISQIESMLPPREGSLENRLKQKKNLEVKDEEFVYFLNVTELLNKGGTEPLERASGEIRMLLRNNREVGFIERVKSELYESAVSKNRVEFFVE